MAVQIGAKPDSGFNDPLGMLKDCHRRIESFLGILCTVADRAKGRSLNVEERNAVQAALQYFRSGGKRHSADEEESLFPRLRASANELHQEVQRLEGEHKQANNLHASVESLYSTWITSNTLNSEDTVKLTTETEQLKELYRGHIQIEETIVFPHAAKVLDSQAITAIGTEFRIRRQSS